MCTNATGLHFPAFPSMNSRFGTAVFRAYLAAYRFFAYWILGLLGDLRRELSDPAVALRTRADFAETFPLKPSAKTIASTDRDDVAFGVKSGVKIAVKVASRNTVSVQTKLLIGEWKPSSVHSTRQLA